MCGIAGVQLRDPALFDRLGGLLEGMVCQAASRGPDSAGVGVYGDTRFGPVDAPRVSLLGTDAATARGALPGCTVVAAGPTTVVGSTAEALPDLIARVRAALPTATVIGTGHSLTLFKGAGDPARLATEFELASATGWQGISHTRMATESAVTPAHSHPFSVAAELCLVHNGSFANHATIRRRLQAEGHVFDTDNDSEVGARFLAHQLASGDDLEKALRRLCETFDGFYTLAVTTADVFAVVRDAIACKPAVIAESDGWVAAASEFRSLAGLPGVADARLFEPEPERVYVWQR